MEREPTYEHRDATVKTYEQVALEALVDALFVESDKKTFAILSKMLQSDHIADLTKKV